MNAETLGSDQGGTKSPTGSDSSSVHEGAVRLHQYTSLIHQQQQYISELENGARRTSDAAAELYLNPSLFEALADHARLNSPDHVSGSVPHGRSSEGRTVGSYSASASASASAGSLDVHLGAAGTSTNSSKEAPRPPLPSLLASGHDSPPGNLHTFSAPSYTSPQSLQQRLASFPLTSQGVSRSAPRLAHTMPARPLFTETCQLEVSHKAGTLLFDDVECLDDVTSGIQGLTGIPTHEQRLYCNGCPVRGTDAIAKLSDGSGTIRLTLESSTSQGPAPDLSGHSPVFVVPSDIQFPAPAQAAGVRGPFPAYEVYAAAAPGSDLTPPRGDASKQLEPLGYAPADGIPPATSPHEGQAGFDSAPTPATVPWPEPTPPPSQRGVTESPSALVFGSEVDEVTEESPAPTPAPAPAPTSVPASSSPTNWKSEPSGKERLREMVQSIGVAGQQDFPMPGFTKSLSSNMEKLIPSFNTDATSHSTHSAPPMSLTRNDVHLTESSSIGEAWENGAKSVRREWPTHVIAVAYPQDTEPVVCCAYKDAPRLRVFQLGKASKELSAIPFTCVQTIATDGDLVVTGGANMLQCWNVTKGRQEWQAKTPRWEIIAAGGGALVCGQATGILYVGKLEDPTSRDEVPLDKCKKSEGPWRNVVVDPPYIIGLDSGNCLFVWHGTGSPNVGKLRGMRKFVDDLPLSVTLCSGVCATKLQKNTGKHETLLWDVKTAGLLTGWSSTKGGAMTLLGNRKDEIVAIDASAGLLRVFKLGVSREPLGEWETPAKMGDAQKLLVAGTTAIIAVHTRGIIEWQPTKRVPACLVM